MDFKGTIASTGISIAKVYKLKEKSIVINNKYSDNPSTELLKLSTAIEKSIAELIKLKDSVTSAKKDEFINIFDAHIEIIKDPELNLLVNDLIVNSNFTAEYAFELTSENFAVKIDSLEDEYMQERAADIRDVKKRVLAHLIKTVVKDLLLIDYEVVIIAKDISPSEIVQLNNEFVKGIITENGGITSHTSIIARSLGIPTIVKVKDIFDNVKNNDIVIVDGLKGNIIINPKVKEINKYKILQETNIKEQDSLQSYKEKLPMTKDLHLVSVMSNILNKEEALHAKDVKALGIGLFRTEFLFINKEEPLSENSQYKYYKSVLELFKSKKVVIRTLDIGGDKHLDYVKDNLNVRGLQLTLNNLELFKTQLKALLRASVYGNLHIMFPFVTSLKQLKVAKDVLKECETELNKQNILFDSSYKLGIMVEVKNVALNIDDYINEVDFFSIGTNDLIHDIFNTPRNIDNTMLQYDPKLLKIIKNIIDIAHKANKWTSICGEMATDDIAIIILLGLGLDDFSVNHSDVLKIKKYISNLNYLDISKEINDLLLLKTKYEVKEFIERKFLKKGGEKYEAN